MGAEQLLSYCATKEDCLGQEGTFFWDGLKLDIQKFVVECLVFQKNKVETIKTLGLL